jgi:hypothetical protein
MYIRIYLKILKKGTNYNHPNSNKQDINHLNRSITENEIEVAIKHSKKQKTPGPGG